MNENLKKSLYDLLKFVIVAIIGILGYYFVDNYISENFPWYTNRTYSALPLYSLAFLQIFFLGMIVFYLWKFSRPAISHSRFLQILNNFYFINAFLIIILILLAYPIEMTNYNILSFIIDVPIWLANILEFYSYFIAYTLPVYFFVMIIYFLVARLVYRK